MSRIVSVSRSVCAGGVWERGLSAARKTAQVKAGQRENPGEAEQPQGAEVHQDMKWTAHILKSDKSLVRSLTRRASALQKIQKIASFKTRKIIGTGIFMSKLIYLIPLWGGCQDYLVRALQVVQNKAARAITKLNIFTPTRVLLKTCQWMSVRQLVIYHSLVLLQKTLEMKMPAYLDSRITMGGSFPYRTRHAETCTIRQVPGNKKDTFKTKLRNWVENKYQ